MLDKAPRIMSWEESKGDNLTTFVHFCCAKKEKAHTRAIVVWLGQMGIHRTDPSGPPLIMNCFSTALPLTVMSTIPVISQPVWALKLISTADARFNHGAN